MNTSGLLLPLSFFFSPNVSFNLIYASTPKQLFSRHCRCHCRYSEEYFNKLEARRTAEGKSVSLTMIWGQHLVELARSVDHIMEENDEEPDDES